MTDTDRSADAEARPDSSDPVEGDQTAGQPSETVPAFSPQRLAWQVSRDRVLRWGVAIGVLALLVTVTTEPVGGGTGFGLSYLPVIGVVVLAIGAWLVINGVSARVSAELGELTEMIEAEPEQAEARIAAHLKRRPLVKWVRLLLYHRLALLRHTQQRYDEAAAICQSLLGYRLGPAEPTRRLLLLVLAEAHLERADAVGAFGPVQALHQASLSLAESLQRLALQTRYELLAGYADRAVWQEPRKRHLAELMPADHCGAMHAMLATAADRCEESGLGRWLWRRTGLLVESDKLDQFKQGRFSVALVKSPPRGEAEMP